MSRVKKVLDNHGLSGENFNTAKPVIFTKDYDEAARNANRILARSNQYDMDESLFNFLNAVIISRELDGDSRYND